MECHNELEIMVSCKVCHRFGFWLRKRAGPDIISWTRRIYLSTSSLLLPMGWELIIQIYTANIRLPAAEIIRSFIPRNKLFKKRMLWSYPFLYQFHPIRIHHW